MTDIYDATDAQSRFAFVKGSGAIAQCQGLSVALWVAAGLDYVGPPDGLGTWSVHRSDLNAGHWVLRDPGDRVLAYVSTQGFAEEIAAAMTVYPGEQPG